VKAKLLVILALTLCSAVFTTQFMAPMANAKKGASLEDVVLAASQYGLPLNVGNSSIILKYDVCNPGGPINMLDLVSLLSNYTGHA
jgi:hypothetical protein